MLQLYQCYQNRAELDSPLRHLTPPGASVLPSTHAVGVSCATGTTSKLRSEALCNVPWSQGNGSYHTSGTWEMCPPRVVGAQGGHSAPCPTAQGGDAACEELACEQRPEARGRFLITSPAAHAVPSDGVPCPSPSPRTGFAHQHSCCIQMLLVLREAGCSAHSCSLLRLQLLWKYCVCSAL